MSLFKTHVMCKVPLKCSTNEIEHAFRMNLSY
jgi:hypothetical protein